MGARALLCDSVCVHVIISDSREYCESALYIVCACCVVSVCKEIEAIYQAGENASTQGRVLGFKNT